MLRNVQCTCRGESPWCHLQPGAQQVWDLPRPGPSHHLLLTVNRLSARHRNLQSCRLLPSAQLGTNISQMTQHQEYSGAASPQHTQLHSSDTEAWIAWCTSCIQTYRQSTDTQCHITISIFKLSCVDIYNMQKWCKLNYKPGRLKILIKYEGLIRELWSCTVMQV